MSQDSYPSHRSHFCIWTLWNQVIFSAYKSDNFFSHYFSLGQCYNSGTWLLIGFIVLSYLEKLSGREAHSVQKKLHFPQYGKPKMWKSLSVNHSWRGVEMVRTGWPLEFVYLSVDWHSLYSSFAFKSCFCFSLNVKKCRRQFHCI